MLGTMGNNVNSKGGLATEGHNCLDDVNAPNLFDAGQNTNRTWGPHFTYRTYYFLWFCQVSTSPPPPKKNTWIRCQNLNIKRIHRKIWLSQFIWKIGRSQIHHEDDCLELNSGRSLSLNRDFLGPPLFPVGLVLLLFLLQS